MSTGRDCALSRVRTTKKEKKIKSDDVRSGAVGVGDDCSVLSPVFQASGEKNLKKKTLIDKVLIQFSFTTFCIFFFHEMRWIRTKESKLDKNVFDCFCSSNM